LLAQISKTVSENRPPSAFSTDHWTVACETPTNRDHSCVATSVDLRGAQYQKLLSGTSFQRSQRWTKCSYQ